MTRKLTSLLGVDALSSRMQAETSRVLDTVNAAGSVGGGRLIEVDLTTTTQEIPHGLGRKWVGAFVVRAETPLQLSTMPTSDDRTFIGLATTTDASIAVWVF